MKKLFALLLALAMVLDKLFAEPIPRSVKLTEAPSFGVPAVTYDRYNKGTQAYVQAAEELLKRVGLPLHP